MQRFSLVFAITCITGCGPVPNPGNSDVEALGDAGADAYEGAYAAVTGTVWAPGQAPGMVPAGHEIPIQGAMVSVSSTWPEPIPQKTYCEKCVDPVGVYTFTAHDGTFTLQNIIPGSYWLSIQKGQFRLVTEISIGEGETLALDTEQSTLPSRPDPNQGKTIPRIAMAVGDYDHLEDILGKMGMGQVDATGRYVPISADGIMDVYTNGAAFEGIVSGTLTDLVSDLDTMLQYHIIFIPCANASNVMALGDQQNLRNIRDFVHAGGKLYVTDWSGEWADNVFPTQVTLGDPGADTPASVYNAVTDTWDTGRFGDADGTEYDSFNAEVVDDNLRTWLGAQSGPLVGNYSGTVPYNPSEFTVEGNWNYITSLDMVQVGENDEGMPVFDVPRPYIIGGRENNLPKRPLTVTYEPTGCGRVLYSTYHTTDNTHNGLVPQERVLLYLLMEIGVCQSGPVVR